METIKETEIKGNILMIIAPSDFRDEELFETKKIFEENAYTVEVTSSQKGIIKGVRGREQNIEKEISEINLGDYNAIVFVGGTGVEKHKLYENQEYKELAKVSHAFNKTIGAICIAPKILAGANLLAGQRATVFSSGKEYLNSKGAIYVKKDVVVDKKIITGNGPDAVDEFALAVIHNIEN
ncbi:MAG: DJ-1/PfpI family protein [Candidatus Aenigmarchaeota archaeon]|nr:DJ-1/PfpI family protein [Candidatus Aenigmarchaeota archaeon]